MLIYINKSISESSTMFLEEHSTNWWTREAKLPALWSQPLSLETGHKGTTSTAQGQLQLLRKHWNPAGSDFWWDLPVGEVPVQWVVRASKSALQKSDPSGFCRMQFLEILHYTRQPKAYLFQQHRLSATVFPGINVAAAGSKEARMDSHWSQRPWMLLAACGTSKVHGDEEIEKNMSLCPQVSSHTSQDSTIKKQMNSQEGL